MTWYCDNLYGHYVYITASSHRVLNQVSEATCDFVYVAVLHGLRRCCPASVQDVSLIVLSGIRRYLLLKLVLRQDLDLSRLFTESFIRVITFEFILLCDTKMRDAAPQRVSKIAG